MADDVNVVCFSGRVGQVRELHRFGDGGSAFSFSLAVNHSVKRNGGFEEETEWLECSLNGKRAEALHPHIYKGLGLMVQGSLRIDRWEKNGQRHSAPKVRVQTLTFGAAPKGGRPQRQRSDGAPSGNAPGAAFGPGDDDIPF